MDEAGRRFADATHSRTTPHDASSSHGVSRCASMRARGYHRSSGVLDWLSALHVQRVRVRVRAAVVQLLGPPLIARRAAVLWNRNFLVAMGSLEFGPV